MNYNVRDPADAAAEEIHRQDAALERGACVVCEKPRTGHEKFCNACAAEREPAPTRATDVDTYGALMLIVVAAGRALRTWDLPDVLRAIEHADAVGPILDPTLWRRSHQRMQEDRELIEAALPLWRAIEKLEKRVAETQGATK